MKNSNLSETYTVGVNKCTVAVELALGELALIDDTVGELVLAVAFFPAAGVRANVTAATPL